MTPIDPSTTVGELVVAVPRRAELFERLGIDYCCGGGRTLAQACAQRGLDPATVAALLGALDDRPLDAREEPHDLGGASIAALCAHVVHAHHDLLRRELPRIADRMATVVRVHRLQRPELDDLRRLFERMRTELVAHLDAEEATLFPACQAVEAEGAAIDEALLAAHEAEHESVGETLVALRELAGGYEPKLTLCGTHRRLLEDLRELELDLHRHVHEENNILFPRVRALAAR